MVSFFRKHPALLVSAFYVTASVIGMFYSWAYLRHFGINVFNYAQLSDFLLASLKEPFTWALVVAAVLMVLMDNATSRSVGQKSPGKWIAWYGSERYRFINNFVAVALVLGFIFAFTTLKAGDTKAGKVELIGISFEESGPVTTMALLGTTSQFVFLYDVQTRRVVIHPIEGIHAISFQAD